MSFEPTSSDLKGCWFESQKGQKCVPSNLKGLGSNPYHCIFVRKKVGLAGIRTHSPLEYFSDVVTERCRVQFPLVANNLKSYSYFPNPLKNETTVQKN